MVKFTKFWLAGVGIAVLALTAVCSGCGVQASPWKPPADRQFIVRTMDISGHQVSLVKVLHVSTEGGTTEYCFGATPEGSVTTWPMLLCQ